MIDMVAKQDVVAYRDPKSKPPSPESKIRLLRTKHAGNMASIVIYLLVVQDSRLLPWLRLRKRRDIVYAPDDQAILISGLSGRRHYQTATSSL